MSAATHQARRCNGTGSALPALRITGLSKTFGATRALIAAALDIRPGEIHALVGQIGSGSSATGFNPEAARLAGVRVVRLRFDSLIVSGGLAGATGIVLASMLGSGSPSAGTPYLLPALAAAFLGATQLKHGRFNAGGTLIAVLLLGTGVTGLALANAPQWAGDMFVGVVLIAARALTGLQRRSTV